MSKKDAFLKYLIEAPDKHGHKISTKIADIIIPKLIDLWDELRLQEQKEVFDELGGWSESNVKFIKTLLFHSWENQIEKLQ